MSEHRWISFHAFGSGDVDALLTGAVAPHVAGRPWFYLRYWEGGPHLRVRLSAPTDIADGLSGALRRHLADHPAPPQFTADTYAALAATLAAREGVADYERELREPGTVAEVPYRPETDAYGTGPSLAAVERHFTESSDLALELVAAGTSRSRRIGAGLLAGLTAMAVAEPDRDRLAAAFSTGWDGAAVPVLEDAFERQRDRLTVAADRAWCGPYGDGDGTLPRWDRSVRGLRHRLDTCFAAGHPAPEPAASPLWWQVDHLPDGQRAAAAVVLRCAHLFCNRLGLTVADEAQINYLIARVLTEPGPTGRETRQ